MPLVSLTEAGNRCRAENTGLGAFNVVQLEMATTLVDAAEAVGAPVVLQISQNAVKYHRGRLEPLGLAALRVAADARVPVVVHLDHATDVALVERAVELGFSSVMYDGSALAFEENVSTTREVAEFCHARGVSVEAELGEVGGKDGVHAPSARTDPREAAAFVRRTGVDLLAVAVGSSHAMTERTAELDTGLIGALASALEVPLVLHGSSGVSDDGMKQAIRAGITKVNVATHLNVCFTAAVRASLDDRPEAVDPRRYLGAGYAAVGPEVERLLSLYSG
ncbi:class II fructose-bisphosphate aldolase [Nocardiopsis sp. HNM0947]|uniref:Class II fructose-bisphosphate aldolase n=1 Tax=Nocardiopsis coralli TaxID=2772213 RepID=A0ABR9PAD9_9ACTN|nr:class II fructose-bisphosphate aldolase [Nocardiopsis coralli]MBE3000650.1 class II fructose-bisphosphate aldolase [Nocardiopsis coralli]